jgi:hypothetical protein
VRKYTAKAKGKTMLFYVNVSLAHTFENTNKIYLNWIGFEHSSSIGALENCIT